MMFPEGTRQKKGLRKKRTARPRTGAARIAHLAGAPLVPAAIKGTDRLARLGEAEGRLRRAVRAGRRRAGGNRTPDARDRCTLRDAMTRPLLVVDGDSFAHRAYHALPKSINRNAVVGFTNMIIAAVGAGAAARRARRLGHARGADLPARGVRGLPVRDASSTRRCSSSSRCCRSSARRSRFAVAKGAGLRGGRLPRRGGRVRGDARRNGARRERRPRRVPARERPDDRPPARARRQRDRAHRARTRCASGTASSRSRCPTSSRCAATRPTSCPARRASGPKTAASLLQQYDSLDAMLAEGRFSAQADELRLYRRIAAMDADGAAARRSPTREPDWEGGAELVRSWGLNQLADRLAARAQ